MHLCLGSFLCAFPSLAAAQTASPAFEVASVKPAPPNADPNEGQWSPPGTGRFKAHSLTLDLLIQLAYGVGAAQIANEPKWLGTNLYDILATPEEGIKLSREELQPRLQALLRERFHLVTHTEIRNLRGYALVVSKTGPTLTPTDGTHFPGWRGNVSSGHMEGFNWSMPYLARMLTPQAGFPVTDETHLTGSYDISFSFEPNPEADSTQPTLPVALKKATGLELKSKLVPVNMIVIDSVDKVPTPN
jgi:uncharacterized protein (TIGR03435 family)